MLGSFLLSGHLLLWSGLSADLISTRIALKPAVFHIEGYKPISLQITHERCLCGERLRTQIPAAAAQGAIVEIVSRLAARDGHPQMARNFQRIFGLFHFSLTAQNIREIRHKSAIVRKYSDGIHTATDSNR